MTLADMFNKLKQRQEQVDELLKTLQTAMENMNKALIHIDSVLKNITDTLAKYDELADETTESVMQLKKDYEDLKKKLNEKPWWKVW